MRFYRLERTEGGLLPADSPLRVGAIIRVRSTTSRKPGAQWNAETSEWVSPVWVECGDPRNEATR